MWLLPNSPGALKVLLGLSIINERAVYYCNNPWRVSSCVRERSIDEFLKIYCKLLWRCTKMAMSVESIAKTPPWPICLSGYLVSNHRYKTEQYLAGLWKRTETLGGQCSRLRKHRLQTFRIRKRRHPGRNKRVQSPWSPPLWMAPGNAADIWSFGVIVSTLPRAHLPRKRLIVA